MRWMIPLLLLPGCALFEPCPVDEPAAMAADTWREARSDGAIDETEIRMLDRDFGWIEQALDEKSKPFQFPTTGIPWVDGALGLAGAAATVYASVKTTNWSRDRKRKKRGEPVEVAKV